jgi:hypothetical protein
MKANSYIFSITVVPEEIIYERRKKDFYRGKYNCTRVSE